MDDMSRKISEILNNPEAMEQIRGLTGLLGGNTAPSDPTASDEQGRTAPSGGSVSDTGLAGMQNVSNPLSPDMLGTVMKLAPLFQSVGTEDDSTRLLRAVKPFLKEERARRVDGAIRLLSIMKILPLLKNSGTDLFNLF